MSTEVNPILSEAEHIFKDVAWTPIMTALKIRFPILGKFFVKTIFDAITDGVFSILKTFIDITYLKFKNPAMQKKYDDAAVALKIIALKKGIDSEEFKNARKIEADNFAQYILYNR